MNAPIPHAPHVRVEVKGELDASIPERSRSACTAAPVARLLTTLDAQYAGRTGVLVFGPPSQPAGLVLLEEGRICWAAAPRTRRRLTALLRDRIRNPGLAGTLEVVYEECRRRNVPLGETLVRKELLSAEDLRDALLQHSVESLRDMRGALSGPHEFRPRGDARYDARFTFSPSELLARSGAIAVGALAPEELALLERAADPEGLAFAFRAPSDDPAEASAWPCLVAALRADVLSIDQLMRLATWVLGHMQCPAAGPSQPSLFAHWDGTGRAVVSYRTSATLSVVVCASAGAAALAISAFDRG